MNSGKCGKCGTWGAVAFWNRFGVILCQACLERHLIEARGERPYDPTPMPRKQFPRTVTAHYLNRVITITLTGDVRPGMQIADWGVVTEPHEWVVHVPMLSGFGAI